MSVLPPDSRALRRELVTAFAGFIVGAGSALAVGIYLFVAHLPLESWWNVPNMLVTTLFASFLAGCCGAIAPMWVLQRWHYRRGIYRCGWCDRPLRGHGVPCECLPAEFRRRPIRRRRRWQQVRRRIPSVLLAYLLLVPPAVLFAAFAPGLRDAHLLVAAIVPHALIAGLIAVVTEFSTDLLKLADRGRRFRLRASAFAHVLAIWPLAFASFMAVYTWMQE